MAGLRGKGGLRTDVLRVILGSALPNIPGDRVGPDYGIEGGVAEYSRLANAQLLPIVVIFTLLFKLADRSKGGEG